MTYSNLMKQMLMTSIDELSKTLGSLWGLNPILHMNTRSILFQFFEDFICTHTTCQQLLQKNFMRSAPGMTQSYL